MSPHTQLVKIAAAALAGATALGGGVALAALTDAPDEADVSQVERAGALPLEEGALEDVLPVDDANDAVNETEDAVKDAEEKAKEAAKDAEEATEEGEDGEGGDTGQHPANHGQVVSNVARNTPPGPGHGKAVSAVARTHGKSVDGGQGDDDTDEVEDETDQEGDGGRSGRGRGHGGKRG